MSFTRTTMNHSLPQWDSDNKPVREDFNDAFESIDSRLKETNTVLAGKAETADTTITQKIADRIYQGTDLSTKHAAEISAAPYNGNVWAWIQARIKAANFTDIHVGDYIPWTSTNGYNFKSEVAGIDTYYNHLIYGGAM